MIRIQVPERGATEIDAPTWSALRAQPDFQLLLEQSVLTANHLPGGRARLRGGCFVGHALCGDFRIEIHEKIAGALLALVQYARRDAFQVTAIDAQTTEIGPLLTELIKHFLQLLRSYVLRGREFAYTHNKRAGPLAGGRLDIVRTLGLRARGMAHLLAFDMPRLSFDTPLNRVLAATLLEIERLSRIIQIDAESVAIARGFSLMFADCRSYRLLSSRRIDLAELASALARDARSSDMADMLSLARVVLAHQSFEPDRFLEQRSPRTWFINLELLFEQAVRSTMARLLRGSGREVVNGREHSAPIFAGETKLYRANPDIVVRGGGRQVDIGDVKYKDLIDAADAGDVYQLLAHATAFHAHQCFLIFPGEQLALKHVGDTADGRRVYLATVNVQQLEASVQELIKSLGLGEVSKLAA
jgi:5-methylcytosine-specific restriction endonuclease McrBC regulatory subunit McrC